MFDLNKIVTDALNAAVQQAVTPLLERITALENNPAIGTDTVLEARVTALEERMDNTTGAASDERIREIAEAAAEQALDDHCSTYDHDQYDEVYNEWGSESPDNFLKDEYVDDQIEEKVKEVLNNASFSISI